MITSNPRLLGTAAAAAAAASTAAAVTILGSRLVELFYYFFYAFYIFCLLVSPSVCLMAREAVGREAVRGETLATETDQANRTERGLADDGRVTLCTGKYYGMVVCAIVLLPVRSDHTGTEGIVWCGLITANP